jgi:hypothetical protein
MASSQAGRDSDSSSTASLERYNRTHCPGPKVANLPPEVTNSSTVGDQNHLSFGKLFYFPEINFFTP